MILASSQVRPSLVRVMLRMSKPPSQNISSVLGVKTWMSTRRLVWVMWRLHRMKPVSGFALRIMRSPTAGIWRLVSVFVAPVAGSRVFNWALGSRLLAAVPGRDVRMVGAVPVASMPRIMPEDLVSQRLVPSAK